MATKKKSSHSKKHSNRPHKSARYAADPISKSALQLIDKASGLLKTSIVAGSRQTARGRQALKKRAFSALNIAARRLNTAIDEGSRALRKGISRM